MIRLALILLAIGFALSITAKVIENNAKQKAEKQKQEQKKEDVKPIQE